MSYSIVLSFAKVDTFEKALLMAHNSVYSKTEDDVLEYLKNNKYGWKVLNNNPITSLTYFMQSYLAVKFVYFEKRKLLAIVGSDTICDSTGFDSRIDFQNSTDNDYGWKEWGPVLTDVYAKELALYKSQKGSAYDRRTSFYNFVKDDLQIEDFLYDPDNCRNVQYFFTFNWMTDMDRVNNMFCLLQKDISEWNKDTL